MNPSRCRSERQTRVGPKTILGLPHGKGHFGGRVDPLSIEKYLEVRCGTRSKARPITKVCTAATVRSVATIIVVLALVRAALAY